MKKILAVVLSVVMALTCCSVAFAAEKTIDNPASAYAPYDAGAHTVTATTTVTEGTTISYSTDGETWSTTAPTWTDATEAQTVYVKAENPNYETAESSGTVTITKLAITVNDTATETYDGSVKTLTITADKAEGVLADETLTLTGATISGTDQGS